ncbi:MAG: bifunctional nuclease family protein [Candidatus Sumerlaeaceae bacterium]|nr:bifunctional nuclease family protein [Candidatus Sumerlaeaceae bacterium]
MAENYIEMELRELQIVDDLGVTQIVVLGEADGGKRSFPIFIGTNEAEALEVAMHRHTARRPMTHDLILNVIEGTGATLERVMVVKLENDTFYGALELRLATGETVQIDSRPSDAIVLATKRQVPIFVEEEVLNEVQRASGGQPGPEDDEEEESEP